MYTTGPVWGRIVDSRGPRILLSCAFVFLLGGYMGMRFLYDAGLPEGIKSLPTLSFVTLVLCSYLTGAGGNGGLTSSVNSTAKTFPDHMVSRTAIQLSFLRAQYSDHFFIFAFSARHNHRTGHLRLWSLRLPLLHDFAHVLPRKHFYVPFHPGCRHRLSHDPGLLFHSTRSVTAT